MLALKMCLSPPLLSSTGCIDFISNWRRSMVLCTAPQRDSVPVKKKTPSNSDGPAQATLKSCVQEQGCWAGTAASYIHCPLGLNLSHVLEEQNCILHASQNCNILWVSSSCLKRCQMAHKRQTSFQESVSHFLGNEPPISAFGAIRGGRRSRSALIASARISYSALRAFTHLCCLTTEESDI